MTQKKEITRDDLMAPEAYGRIRDEKRREAMALKKARRLHVGPFATFYFENYDIMWRQVHEMLFIEGGGEAQIEEELEAYNPLIPNGRELVATFMLEIPDEDQRRELLARLGGIEESISIHVGEEVIRAEAETDVDRTTAAGKASSVHFLHFPFSEAQIERFRKPDVKVMLAIDHPEYQHMAGIAGPARSQLAEDFDP